jgi:hypothetical protein
VVRWGVNFAEVPPPLLFAFSWGTVRFSATMVTGVQRAYSSAQCPFCHAQLAYSMYFILVLSSLKGS